MKTTKHSKTTPTELTITDLAFSRADRFGIDRLVVLRFTHTLESKKEVYNALQQGVTAWIENYPTGLQAWHESSEDFNIGDFCSTQDFHLQACLEARGIHSVETLYELCQGEDHTYDAVLACPNLEPEELYREDGERFSRNVHGYYSLDSSKMQPPYSYSYSDLMETGKFSRTNSKIKNKTKKKSGNDTLEK